MLGLLTARCTHTHAKEKGLRAKESVPPRKKKKKSQQVQRAASKEAARETKAQGERRRTGRGAFAALGISKT